MSYSTLDMQVLELMAADCRVAAAAAARMLGADAAAVEASIARLEEDRVLAGYGALIQWDRTEREYVQAAIEVRVTPQRDMGFDAIAARIYRFDEVRSVYLMSGAYDLLLIVEARTLRQLASFVSEKLSTLDHVLSTATHFVLKKYKSEGVLLADDADEQRLVVTP